VAVRAGSLIVSHFITTLDVRKLPRDGSADGRGTWKLLAPLIYNSDLLGRLVIVPAGFVTDFASVPRLPVAYLLTANCGHEAAVLHDFAYTAHDMTRAQADDLFAEALAVGGEPGWRRGLMWAGVRVGGWWAWDAPGQSQPPAVAAKIEAVHPDAS
jgi:hypothetical protein